MHRDKADLNLQAPFPILDNTDYSTPQCKQESLTLHRFTVFNQGKMEGINLI